LNGLIGNRIIVLYSINKPSRSLWLDL